MQSLFLGKATGLRCGHKYMSIYSNCKRDKVIQLRRSVNLLLLSLRSVATNGLVLLLVKQLLLFNEVNGIPYIL